MLDPGTEAVVGGGDSTIVGGKLAPLAAGAGQPDQAVKNATGILRGTSGFLAGFVDDEQGCNSVPEGIGGFPDDRLGIDLRLVVLCRGQGLSLALFE